MKRIVILTLTTGVVVAAFALVNANLASTTAVCTEEPKGGLCKGVSGSLEGEANPTKFETSVGTITCRTNLGVVPAEPSSPKGTPISITGFFFFWPSSCKNESGQTCTIPEPTEFSGTLSWTSGVNGAIKGSKGPKISLNCKEINCTYTLESELEVLGGKSASIVANKEVLGSATGALCPGGGAPISFTGTYKLGTLYLGETSPPVTLCKKNETPCSAGETYGVPTTLVASLEPGGVAKLKLKITEESETTEYTVACGSSTLEGKTTAASWPTKAEVTSILFGECGGTCAAKAIKPPFTATVEANGAGNGQITWLPRLQVRCIGAYKCTYEASTNVNSSITGGAPAKLPVALSANKLVTTESDTKCGATLTWEGAYRFTKPEAGGEAKMWVVREGI
jgi:hypothetical protein